MTDHFIPLRSPAPMIRGGLLLAVNPSAVFAITSGWDEKSKQNFLCLHFPDKIRCSVSEEAAPEVLEALGLGEYEDDWTLNLMKDV